MKQFLLIISKQPKNDLCQIGSTVTMFRLGWVSILILLMVIPLVMSHIETNDLSCETLFRDSIVCIGKRSRLSQQFCAGFIYVSRMG